MAKYLANARQVKSLYFLGSRFLKYCVVLTPEEQEHCHEKGLEVVVSIELCVVVYSNLPKYLSTRQTRRNVQGMKTHQRDYEMSRTHEGKGEMRKISQPASRLHHK